MTTRIEAVATVEGGRWHGRSARKLTDAAAARALERAGLASDDVDLLVNAGLYHDRILGEPALAALIQEDIGANPEDPHEGHHGTFSFDVANGSCGMLTGLMVADGFLRAGTVRHALIVAGDADPGHRLAPGFPFAPTGGAIVCGWDDGPGGVVDIRLANQVPGDDADFRATVALRGRRNTLAIDEDPGFAAAAGSWAAEVAAKLLADHGLAARDLDLVVANPLTEAFLDALGHDLGVPADRLVAPPAGRAAGHTAGLAVALGDAIGAGRLAGPTTLLVSAGAGLTAGVALVRG
ncbi:MAG: 3-oxoacyl-[acyl-carrier-protein] synthase III C-terminal domain-containing protein [Acidimicrobiales bacterium]